MLVHLAVQEHGARKGTPRAAQIRLTRRALARQFAIVEHQPVRRLLRGIRRRVQPAALVHEQRAALKPAAVRPEDEVHVALNIAVLKILAVQRQRAVPYGRDPLRNQPRQSIPRHFRHRRAAEQRVLMRNHPHISPHAAVARRIHRHRLPDQRTVARVVADGQVLHLHVIPRDQKRVAEERALLLSVRVQILGTAGVGDDGAVARFADDADVVLVHNHLFVVLVHPQQEDGGHPAAHGHGINRRLKGGEIPRTVLGNDIHRYSPIIPYFFILFSNENAQADGAGEFENSISISAVIFAKNSAPARWVCVSSFDPSG